MRSHRPDETLRVTPRGPLTVAAAQPATRALDVVANVAAHAAAVRAAGARVVVFPELSLTGYEHGAAALAADDPRLGPLVAACGAAGSVALVGATVTSDDETGRSIGVLRVDGEGARVVYRKQHLGGEEPRWWVAGPAPAVVEVDGWRLGLAVCRDTGVPAHADATAALGIDAYVAGVVTAAADATQVADRATATARRLGVWVVVASHAGPTGGGYARTAGGSGVWDPAGYAVARAGTDVDELAGAVLRAGADGPGAGTGPTLVG